MEYLYRPMTCKRHWINSNLQLIINLSLALITEKIVGAEALLRWQLSEQKLLTPNYFISLCETSGLIIPIGLWTLRTACQQLKQWQALGYQYLDMAVNFSVSSLATLE